MIDLNAVSRMLTLRYDPKRKPVRRPLSPSNFRPIDMHNLESKIMQIIQTDLLEKHKTLKFNRISLSLSGGVDSRLSLAMLRTFLPEVDVSCICVGFGDDNDEVGIAREIARFNNCDFHELIIDNVLADLPKLIGIVKEPRWNLYQYYAFEHGKRISNVFYTGDGGDELFGGYTFRYHKFLALLRSRGSKWEEKVKLYLECHERDWVPDQANLFGPAIKFSWDKVYGLLRPYFDNSATPLDQVFMADFNGKLLHDWMPTNISFARFLDIHIESMFLTDEMVNLSTHIPWHEKYDPDRQIGKLPLRSILNKQYGYERIEILKRGFSFDLASVWNKNAREIVTSYLNNDSEVVKNRLVSSAWIKKTMKNLRENSIELNPRFINKMLGLLALEVWYRLYVSRTMKSGKKL